MQLKRVPATQLADDLSNLEEIRLTKLREALNSPRQEEIVIKIMQDMLIAGQSGQGVRFDEIPAPLVQSGLECQIMAILNGMRAIGKENLITELFLDVRTAISQIRRKVQADGLAGKTGAFDLDTGSTIDANAHFSMPSMATEIARCGIPLIRRRAPGNPIELAKGLFQPNRFMGAGIDRTWHAKTIVPLTPATPEQFMAELDSLGRGKRCMSIEEFLRFTLRKDEISDCFEIYEVIEPEQPEATRGTQIAALIEAHIDPARRAQINRALTAARPNMTLAEYIDQMPEPAALQLPLVRRHDQSIAEAYMQVLNFELGASALDITRRRR